MKDDKKLTEELQKNKEELNRRKEILEDEYYSRKKAFSYSEDYYLDKLKRMNSALDSRDVQSNSEMRDFYLEKCQTTKKTLSDEYERAEMLEREFLYESNRNDEEINYINYQIAAINDTNKEGESENGE